MVNLTINGKKVEVPEGTTVLEAANKLRIKIPTLCYHPELKPYGGCRLCVVEVEGMRTLQTSCTLPVSNNMVVQTDSEKIHRARKFVLSMIFNERNHFCPYCEVSDGDCKLQNAAYGEEMTHWPIQPNWKPFHVDGSHPFIVLDNNRCILCRLCVRACEELVGNHTLAFKERGERSMLIADLDVPLGDSSCVNCGTCVQVCPTGALIDRMSAYQGQETELDKVKTICIGCSVGCNIEVLSRDNRLVCIEGDWDGKVNGGIICEVGRFRPMIEERERILTPMIRKNDTLKAATWEEAYKEIIKILEPLLEKKDNGIAGVISNRLPVESMYLFKQIFVDNFKSSIATSLDEGKQTATISKLVDNEGVPIEAKLEDLRKSDCFIVIGEDITKDHQVLSFFIKRSLSDETKLITISPGPNGLDNFANIAIKVVPEKEGDVITIISKALTANGKELDTLLVDLAKISNIKKEMSLKVIKFIKTSIMPFIVYSGKSSCSTKESVYAIYELSKVSKAQLLSTKSGANSFAAAQFHLDVPLILDGVKAIYIALGDEQPAQKFTEKIKNVPHIIVQSSYTSLLTASADVVLPVYNWLEQEGHYINLEGRIQKANASLSAPEYVRCNTETLNILAEKMNLNISKGWKKHLLNRVSISMMG